VTVCQSLLEAAARAPRLLGASTALVAEFLLGQLAPSGGFRGRDQAPDLYYTAFGLMAARAIGADLPGERVRQFLDSFGDGEQLDLVHLASLARCLACLAPDALEKARRAALAQCLDRLALADGGFSHRREARAPSVYGSFLALGAYQDLGAESPAALGESLKALKLPDGSYANEPGSPSGSTPATAAAVVIGEQLNRAADPATLEWLLERAHPAGGFLAAPRAPIPDLLSTATALHALAVAGGDFGALAPSCLDFVESLWNGRGAFAGSPLDPTPDCEYTFYALLALGHLCECYG